MRVNIKVKVSLPRDLEELSAGDSEATTDTLSGVQADCIAHHNAEGKGPLEVTDVDEVVPLDGQKSCEIDENQDLPTSDEKAATRQDAIFVEWAKDDPENPFNWPNKKKHLIAGVSIIMTLFVAAAATCYAWGASQIAEELQVSETVSLLGSSVFTLGFGVAPMALAPLSEVYGRSPVYLITYGLFALSFIPQALSPNITCLLISRFISGAMGSTGSTMVGGTLADIYHADTRGGPMSVFSSVTLYGTALGSITAAYVVVNGNMGWRWIFWLQLILNSLHFVLVSCILRETRGSVLLSRRAAKIRQETGDDRYVAATDAERSSLFVMIRLSLTRPFVFLFTEPAVIAYSVWVSFVWGVLFLFLKAVPTLFQSVYGWSYGTSSLPFLGMIAGTTLALGLAPVQDMLYNNSARFHKGVPRSEARLYASMLGSSLFAIGMFVFGWCAYRHVHWIGSVVGLALTSFGIFTIYLAVFNILADTYGKFASSALASQSFLRNVFASGFPLFASQMYKRMGIHWASTLLGIIGLVLTAVPFLLYIHGPRVRRASKYASGDQH